MCPRLILEFDLRTKEDSGLLLYMARVNHADFVAVQVTWDFDVSPTSVNSSDAVIFLLLTCTLFKIRLHHCVKRI